MRLYAYAHFFRNYFTRRHTHTHVCVDKSCFLLQDIAWVLFGQSRIYFRGFSPKPYCCFSYRKDSVPDWGSLKGYRDLKKSTEV